MKWNKLLAVFLACLLLSGCAGGASNEPPVSAPQEPAQTGVVYPELEQKEPPLVEEASASAEMTETEHEPDPVISAAPEAEVVPDPVEPEEEQSAPTENTCTISICCATILEHLDELAEGKEALVPANGWILEPVEVTFNEGESVFHILRRTCKQQKVHMEFENTPVYHSAYIEGIGNLYEFDCGELSGWKYRVNGWFPNYGCSQYQVQSGDVIEWLYTCDLGADVGGGAIQ